MVIEHFILAKSAAVDATTNQLSLFELVEDITVQNADFPLDIAFNVIGVLRRTPEDPPEVGHRFELVIEGPNNKRILFETIEVRMEPQHRRNRVRFMLTIALDGVGTYRATFRETGSAPGTARVIELQVLSTTAPTMVQ